MMTMQFAEDLFPTLEVLEGKVSMHCKPNFERVTESSCLSNSLEVADDGAASNNKKSKKSQLPPEKESNSHFNFSERFDSLDVGVKPENLCWIFFTSGDHKVAFVDFCQSSAGSCTPDPCGPCCLAWVPLRTGSTGEPKGVMCEHRCAVSYAMNHPFLRDARGGPTLVSHCLTLVSLSLSHSRLSHSSLPPPL